MADAEPSSLQPDAVSETVPRPHLTDTNSAPPRKTEPGWPAVIIVSASGQLLFVTDREQWDSDVGLHLQEFAPDDLMIDSLGRVFSLASAQAGMVWAGIPRRSIEVIPQAKSISAEDFRAFMEAHLEWCGLVAEEVLRDTDSADQSIGSLILHLVRALSIDIPESESEFGVARAARIVDRETKEFEPPQFSIRTILIILTVVAVGCSAVASNYFGFGSFRTLFIAVFTCAVFLLLLWIVVGAHTDSRK